MDVTTFEDLVSFIGNLAIVLAKLIVAISLSAIFVAVLHWALRELSIPIH